MVNYYYILIICLIQTTISIAQPAIQWSKSFGGPSADEPACFQRTTDGGYIIAGYTYANGGDVSGFHGGATDFWVVKTDSNGNFQWQKCYGGTSGEEAKSIQQTQDGGYILGGFTWSNNGDVSGNHGNTDAWITKIDSVGNLEWQRCLGGGWINGTSSGYDNAEAIKETLDGGYIVAASSTSGNGDVTGLHVANWYSSDFWIVKLNATGNIQWEKCLGGYLNELVRGLALCSDSGFVFVGEANSNDGDISGNHDTTGYYCDYWVVKTNSLGDILWQRCYGGTKKDAPQTINNTSDGGYIIAGNTLSYDGDLTFRHDTIHYINDGWVIKIDSIGNLQWQKCLGGTIIDFCNSVVQISDGGYIVGGTTSSNDFEASLNHGGSDAFIVKLDSAGNIEWHSCYGNDSTHGQECVAILETVDGHYTFVGDSYSGGGDVNGFHGVQDIWLVKLSDISLTNVEIATCGFCNGTATALPTSGTPPFTFQWSQGQTTSTVTNLCYGVNSVTITDATGVVSQGSFTVINNTMSVHLVHSNASCSACPDATVTLFPNGGIGAYTYFWQGYPDTTATLSGLLPYNWVIGCVTDSIGCMICDSIYLGVVGTNEILQMVSSVQIFPNPLNQTSQIKWVQLRNETVSIKLLDIAGREIFTLADEEFSQGEHVISLTTDDAAIRDGLYFIKVTAGDFVEMKKLLIFKQF